jgi:hypothetical protein
VRLRRLGRGGSKCSQATRHSCTCTRLLGTRHCMFYLTPQRCACPVSQDLATRARDNKLKPDEFQGGSFTYACAAAARAQPSSTQRRKRPKAPSPAAVDCATARLCGLLREGTANAQSALGCGAAHTRSGPEDPALALLPRSHCELGCRPTPAHPMGVGMLAHETRTRHARAPRRTRIGRVRCTSRTAPVAHPGSHKAPIGQSVPSLWRIACGPCVAGSLT